MNIGIEVLKGKTIFNIKQDYNELLFFTECKKVYRMYHFNDCCESVEIEDICGSLDDIIGSPILMAEEEISQENPRIGNTDSSFTWTFYKLATIKGYVTIRWYGTSNGYYSESIELHDVTEEYPDLVEIKVNGQIKQFVDEVD